MWHWGPLLLWNFVVNIKSSMDWGRYEPIKTQCQQPESKPCLLCNQARLIASEPTESYSHVYPHCLPSQEMALAPTYQSRAASGSPNKGLFSTLDGNSQPVARAIYSLVGDLGEKYVGYSGTGKTGTQESWSVFETLLFTERTNTNFT